MAKKKSRRSTWLDQAKAQTLVRYGPELSALTALRSENVTDYHRALHQATAGRVGEQAAVAAALPQLKAIYAANDANRNQAANLAGGNLAGLGAAAGAFKVAAAQELGGALAALSQTGAQAQADLVGRGVRAAESEAGARRSALAQYRTDQAKVTARHQDLLGEMGAYTAATAGDLSEKAAGRAVTRANNRDSARQSERNSVRSSGIDPDTGKPIPGGKLDPKAKTKAADVFKDKYGVALASPDAHRSLVKNISNETDRVGDLVKKAKTDGRSRAEVDRVLRTGIKGGSVHDPATGRLKVDKNSGLAVTAPDVKPVGSLERGIILDLIFDGHVSARHAAALHKQGYSVSRLGLPGSTPEQRKRARREAKTVGSVADTLARALA